MLVRDVEEMRIDIAVTEEKHERLINAMGLCIKQLEILLYQDELSTIQFEEDEAKHLAARAEESQLELLKAEKACAEARDVQEKKDEITKDRLKNNMICHIRARSLITAAAGLLPLPAMAVQRRVVRGARSTVDQPLE